MILKEIKLGKVGFCYEASYEAVHTRICQILKEEGRKLFAFIRIGNSNITWYQPEKDLREYRSFVDATEEEKMAIAYIFDEKCQKYKTVLQKAKLNLIFEIPSFEYIFFTEREGHGNDVPLNRYDIIITGWACKSTEAETEGKTSVAQWVAKFKATHQHVILKFMDGQGKLLSDQVFAYTYLGRSVERSAKSDEEGKVDMGMVYIGGILNFMNNSTGEHRSIRVISGQTDYDVMFSPLFSYDIRVVSQTNEPMAGIDLSATYGNHNEKFLTDIDGRASSSAQLTLNEELGKLTIHLGAYGNFEFDVKAPVTHCEIKINKQDPQPEPEPEPQPEAAPEPPIEPSVEIQSVIIRVVNADGIPQDQHALNINGIRYITENDGGVSLGEKNVGSTIFAASEKFPYVADTFLVEKGREEYILTLPISEEQNVYLKVINQDNEPMPGLQVGIQLIKGDNRLHITDTNGVVYIGKLNVGDVFTAMAAKVSAHFTVKKGIEEYVLRIVTPKTVIIRLYDIDGEIIPGASITLKNHKGVKVTKITDLNGEIQQPYEYFTHQEKVKVHTELQKEKHTKVDNCSIKFDQACLDYEIRLKKKFPWGCLYKLLGVLLLLLLLLVRCNKDVVVQTVTENGIPISGATVNYDHTERALWKGGEVFYSHVEHGVGLTDSLGYYTFSNQRHSIASWIFFNLTRETVYATKNFLEGVQNFYFHWQGNLTGPIKVIMQGEIRICVKDAVTQRPISNANIQGTYSEEGITKQIDVVTDGDGYARLEVIDSKGRFEDVFITKTGYSGDRIYQLSFLDISNQELVIYLNPPIPCSDQSLENSKRDKSDHCVVDYDMRQPSGRFVFKYYTDSAPDEIIVYDCSSVDIKPEKMIFHYSGSTNTSTPEDYKELTFSSQQICVVVNGQTNWGYVVGCPR